MLKKLMTKLDWNNVCLCLKTSRQNRRSWHEAGPRVGQGAISPSQKACFISCSHAQNTHKVKQNHSGKVCR